MNRKGNIVLPEQITELEKRNVLRLSNEESNRLTRECVETALMLLMQEKEYTDISITDIIRKSGVSRSAYYRNFPTKEDVLKTIFDKAVDMITKDIETPLHNQDRRTCFIVLFQNVAESEDLFQIILKADLEKQLVDAINQRLLQNIPEKEYKNRYLILSWIGGTMNILLNWLKEGMPMSPSAMASLCIELSVGGIADYNVADTMIKK